MKQLTQRDLQAESRRIQLLDIALALFAERGVENVSIKDLAAEAGIAPGLIYHYFTSKDDLLAAVFQRYSPLPEFEAVIEQMSDLTAPEGLQHFATSLAVIMGQKRAVIRLLARELLSPRASSLAVVVSFRETVVARLHDTFQRWIAAGELRPHEPLVTVHMLVSSLLILLLLEQPFEPLIPQFVATIMDGIQA